MALGSRKVSIQDGRQWIGKGSTRGMVFAIPALLTLGFVMRPGHAEDSFRFVTDPELDRRIDAYMPVVMETKPFLERSGLVRDSEADRLAGRWIEESEAGKLKSLRPLLLGDTVSEGTTGEILRIQGALANTLMLRGEKHVRSGEMREGAEDLITAARVLRPTQYSDLQTASLTGLQYRRVLSMLGRAVKKMDSENRAWLREAIVPLRSDSDQLADMALTMRRLYDESVWRKTGASISETPGLTALSSLRRPPEGKEIETMRKVSEAIELDENPKELRPLTASLRRVLENEIHTNTRVDEIRQMD